MNTRDILALTMVKGIGPSTIKKHIHRLKSNIDLEELVMELKPEEIKNINNYIHAAETNLLTCQKEGIEVIDISSSDYPFLLKEITNPPAILYIKGNKSLLKNKIIAIIGTRHSSHLGNNIAERLGEYFSQRFAICNGLVEGIDEHSIYINGKITSNVIGIISGGLCYKSTCSKNHIRVIEDVLKNNGLIISEYPPLKKEDQFSGSASSRIQAGLSSGIILVQSKIGGGSKYTLDKFVKLDRVVGIINFPAHPEYQNDIFDANRTILQDKEHGIANFVGLKTNNTLKIKALIPISNRTDYIEFENILTTQFTSTLFV